MGLSEKKVKDAEVQNEVPVVDIDLSVTRKKRFRIDGDNKRILELNTSDMGIITRLQDLTPKLEALQNKAVNVDDADSDEDAFNKSADLLKEIDKEMREIMDELFASNVSSVCAPDGSMYDPFNGKFRFEHIIDALMPLYEQNVTEEYKRMSKRVQLHTQKYTKKKK